MSARRGGSALVEVMMAATLLGILGTAAALLIHAEATILRHTAEHAATDESLRSIRSIIRAELRQLAPIDLHGLARDSISARIFRGWGIVCAVDTAAVTLRYRGLRDPAADKDSLLIAGAERTATFSDAFRTPEPCDHAADEELIVIAPSLRVATGAVVLFFETGAYHLADHALRYRRGSEGRQPLTVENIDAARSTFAIDSGRRTIRMLLRGTVLPAKAARTARSSFRLLNPP